MSKVGTGAGGKKLELKVVQSKNCSANTPLLYVDADTKNVYVTQDAPRAATGDIWVRTAGYSTNYSIPLTVGEKAPISVGVLGCFQWNGQSWEAKEWAIRPPGEEWSVSPTFLYHFGIEFALSGGWERVLSTSDTYGSKNEASLYGYGFYGETYFRSIAAVDVTKFKKLKCVVRLDQVGSEAYFSLICGNKGTNYTETNTLRILELNIEEITGAQAIRLRFLSGERKGCKGTIYAVWLE